MEIMSCPGGCIEAAEAHRPPGKSLRPDAMPSTGRTGIFQSANPMRIRMYSRFTKNFWESR
ncbi:MAG: hypothetical protein ACLUD2_06125 [Clostridium sp.]